MNLPALHYAYCKYLRKIRRYLYLTIALASLKKEIIRLLF